MGAQTLKIAFAGTPAFAAIHLEKLLSTAHKLVAVLSQPDRPSGRGKKLLPSAVKKIALDHQIPIYQPDSMLEPGLADEFLGLEPDILIVVAYGLIIPEQILDIPKQGCLNVHGSILPKWRGAAPIQRAIESGDKETGVTIMRMDPGLDTGDALAIARVPIDTATTSAEMADKLAALGSDLLVSVLSNLDYYLRNATSQDSLPGEPSYAKKLLKSESEIDWSSDAEVISRKINAFNPSPGCCSHLDNIRIKIWQAKPVDDQYRGLFPGTISSQTKRSLKVACGNGQKELIKLQLPGGRILPAQALLAAHKTLFQVGKKFHSGSKS